MDIADLADRYIEDQLLSSLHRMQRTQKPKVNSIETCEECGVAIPPARRRAVPGCTQCVTCAEDLERKLAGYSRNAVFNGHAGMLDDYLYNVS